MEKWTVTRQVYWDSGAHVVEIAGGGIDYCNPDALCAKYPGEFDEYNDPREAVEVAIDICRQWRKDGEKSAYLTLGCTGGCTMYFDSITFAEAIKWGDKVYESLEKCIICGDLINQDEYYVDEFGENKYCREYCAEKAQSEIDELNAE